MVSREINLNIRAITSTPRGIQTLDPEVALQY